MTRIIVPEMAAPAAALVTAGRAPPACRDSDKGRKVEAQCGVWLQAVSLVCMQVAERKGRAGGQHCWAGQGWRCSLDAGGRPLVGASGCWLTQPWTPLSVHPQPSHPSPLLLRGQDPHRRAVLGRLRLGGTGQPHCVTSATCSKVWRTGLENCEGSRT